MGQSTECTERFIHSIIIIVDIIVWLQDASCTDIGGSEEQRVSSG